MFNLLIKSETCFDINECMTNPCIVPYECENTDGSYICECADGYERDQGDICRNIDECERNELAENKLNLCPEKGNGFTDSFLMFIWIKSERCILRSLKRGNLLRYRRFI